VTLGVRDEFQLGAAGINVPLCGTNTVAVAHVLPLTRRDEAARMSSAAAAAIFIAAPGVSPKPAIEAVAALFGLTPAEKRVAAQVAEGLSRKDIALANGVSDGTVKTQLAVIFDKTGTHDQRQLELLIREITPPVR
jgi:DNA-binding CsgD family transcriptional regulator